MVSGCYRYSNASNRIKAIFLSSLCCSQALTPAGLYKNTSRTSCHNLSCRIIDIGIAIRFFIAAGDRATAPRLVPAIGWPIVLADVFLGSTDRGATVRRSTPHKSAWRLQTNVSCYQGSVSLLPQDAHRRRSQAVKCWGKTGKIRNFMNFMNFMTMPGSKCFLLTNTNNWNSPKILPILPRSFPDPSQIFPGCQVTVHCIGIIAALCLRVAHLQDLKGWCSDRLNPNSLLIPCHTLATFSMPWMENIGTCFILYIYI